MLKKRDADQRRAKALEDSLAAAKQKELDRIQKQEAKAKQKLVDNVNKLKKAADEAHQQLRLANEKGEKRQIAGKVKKLETAQTKLRDAEAALRLHTDGKGSEVPDDVESDTDSSYSNSVESDSGSHRLATPRVVSQKSSALPPLFCRLHVDVCAAPHLGRLSCRPSC